MSRQNPPAGEPAELADIAQLVSEAQAAGSGLQCRIACEVSAGDRRFPVHVLTIGNAEPDAPALGIFGGVHGLERIGAELVIAFLRSLLSRLQWDDSVHYLLKGLRLVMMPLVNPGGLWRGTRANPQGVDLMRNSPVDSEHGVPMLLGGQRLSASLPWYRGALGAPMQIESTALCQVVEQELLSHRFAMSIDCHSGFGLTDRIWLPHAHTPQPVEHLPELLSLGELLDETLLHHRYVFEPQSLQYLCHGDLWDHLYLKAQHTGRCMLLPLTLEMGSWLWVKKNPRQMFSRHGIFNPLIEHRRQRVLRRHLALIDFLMRAAHSHARWAPAPAQREAVRERALDRWYRRRSDR